MNAANTSFAKRPVLSSKKPFNKGFNKNQSVNTLTKELSVEDEDKLELPITDDEYEHDYKGKGSQRLDKDERKRYSRIRKVRQQKRGR